MLWEMFLVVCGFALQQGTLLYREQVLWAFQGCLRVLLSPPSQADALLM